MGKALVRIVVVLTVIYFLISYYVAQFCFVDIMGDWYILPFELIIVVYSYSEGKYHCRYLKHCALGVFTCDTLTRIDNTFDFMSVDVHNLLPLSILAISLSVSIFKALKHFAKVQSIKSRHVK